MNKVPLGEEELAEVGTVLTGDTYLISLALLQSVLTVIGHVDRTCSSQRLIKHTRDQRDLALAVLLGGPDVVAGHDRVGGLHFVCVLVGWAGEKGVCGGV